MDRFSTEVLRPKADENPVGTERFPGHECATRIEG
jgi:hypothetical protein